MRFWLYVNGAKHSFIEGDRIPLVGETVIYRDERSSTMEEAVVEKFKTEFMTGKSDVANPLGMIGYLYTKTQQ